MSSKKAKHTAKKNKNTSKAQKIKELSEENQQLKREIEGLKQEINELKGKPTVHKKGDTVSNNFENLSLNAKLYSKKSYTSYLLGQLINTSVFRLYKKMILIVKKYTFISTTLKILAYILAIVQSGAVFVLAASFSILSLPLTFVVGYAALAAAFFGRRKLKKTVTGFAEDKNIVVMFPSKGRPFESNSFFAGMVSEAAADNAVIVVSPYFFSSKGIFGNKKMFIAAKEESNILLVRRHFYFTLKRKLFKKHNKKITFVY